MTDAMSHCEVDHVIDCILKTLMDLSIEQMTS